MVKLPKAPQSMLQNPNGNKINKGVTVVELLVVVFVLLVAFVGILGVLTFSLQTSSLIKETTYANFLAQDTMEAVRNFRDGTDWEDINGLGTLPTGDTNPHHPEKTADNPPKWTLVAGEETINNFTRKIVFENVQRDGNDNIVEVGGINDPDTKKIKVTVSWKNKTVEITTYFTNWQ